MRRCVPHVAAHVQLGRRRYVAAGVDSINRNWLEGQSLAERWIDDRGLPHRTLVVTVLAAEFCGNAKMLDVLDGNPEIPEGYPNRRIRHKYARKDVVDFWRQRHKQS